MKEEEEEARRKLPATPPRRDPSPEATTAHGGPSWLLLDSFVHCSRRRRGVFEGDATTSEIAYDCAGRRMRVSLRIADPPVVSRLYLHWTGTPPIKRMMEPSVIAAHSHSILFMVSVPLENPMWWDWHMYMSCFFPIDYLVYSASSSSNLPSLTRLPPCFDENRRVLKNDEEGNKMFRFQPYRRQQQRCMSDQDMGLLCHGEDGEFTVVQLTYYDPHEVELCLLHHPPRASGIIPTTQWRIKKLPVPPDMKKINPSLWTTDVVLPVGDGRSLCWVDYYHGMLLVDVLLANNGDPADQRYIPLPKQALKSTRPCPDAFSPDPYRHVCITDAGIVKLVCIFTEYSRATFTIITWSLNIHRGNWIKDCSTIMGDAEFFSLFDAAAESNLLPRVKPGFPVVSLADPDVICFLLQDEDEDHNSYWAIEVNMREKVLRSTAPYIGGEEEEGYSPNNKPRVNFYGQYFVPSKFSSYLGQDAATSRKLSVLLKDKAIQRRVMRKQAKLKN